MQRKGRLLTESSAGRCLSAEGAIEKSSHLPATHHPSEPDPLGFPVLSSTTLGGELFTPPLKAGAQAMQGLTLLKTQLTFPYPAWGGVGEGGIYCLAGEWGGLSASSLKGTGASFADPT